MAGWCRLAAIDLRGRQPKARCFIKLKRRRPTPPFGRRDRVSIEAIGTDTVSQNQKQIDSLVHAGAERLLSRAANSRGLEAPSLAARIRTGVSKYVSKDSPSAGPAEIDRFI